MKKITRGNPFPMGASVLEDGLVQFVIGAEQGKEYSLVLYDKKNKHQDFAFNEELIKPYYLENVLKETVMIYERKN